MPEAQPPIGCQGVRVKIPSRKQLEVIRVSQSLVVYFIPRAACVVWLLYAVGV